MKRMSEANAAKQCTKCNTIKPLSEFYKHPTCKYGCAAECRQCTKQRMKAYHQTKRGKQVTRKALKRYRKTIEGKAKEKQYYDEYTQKHPMRIKAKNAIRIAVKTGKILKASAYKCFYCEKQGRDYHHHKGYACENHLNVIPLCSSCHNQIHKTSNNR